MNRKEAPHQSFAPYGVHDRKVKLRDPRPVYLQPLPRDASCVNKTNLFGSHRGCRHAGRPLHRRLRLLSAGCRPPSWFSYGKINRPTRVEVRNGDCSHQMGYERNRMG